MSNLGIPVNVEKSEITTGLNSSFLLVYLMGMYTIIYFGTIYIYFSRISSNRRLVPTVITMLFLTNIIQVGAQWFDTKWIFVNNGDTRDSVTVALYSTPVPVSLISLISTYLGFVLGDGLLIWRCYNVWDRSVRVISVPLLLIVTEAGLFLVQIVLHAVFAVKAVSPGQAATFNALLCAAFFMSFATSLATTILIAHRIYAVLKQEGTSTKRFKHILDIVVQSGVFYSLALFVAAISSVAPGANNLLNTRVFALQLYVQGLIGPIAGMSATILVTRVALLSSETTFPSTSVHLSGLQFHARSTHPTDALEMVEANESMIVDRNFDRETQEVENKVE